MAAVTLDKVLISKETCKNELELSDIKYCNVSLLLTAAIKVQKNRA